MERESHDPLAAPPAGADPMQASGNASAEAVRELALALRTSVETMHGVRDLQAELVKNLKRSDRSEMVLQSTQTLNETFRNLSTIQRELVSRLEATEKRKSSGSRLLPMMILGLLVVFLGGVFLVLDVLDKMKDERRDLVAGLREADESSLAAYREGKAEARSEGEVRESRLGAELERREAQLAALQTRFESEAASRRELEAERKTLESERDAFAGQVRAAENAVIAQQAVEAELDDVTRRLAVVEPRMADLQRDLEAERAAAQELRVRLGREALGQPTTPDPTADPTAPPAGPAAAEIGLLPPPTEPGGDAPAVAEPGITRDPRFLEKVRSRLNQMLEDSAKRKQDVWQVTRIDGVAPDGLLGVIALRYDRKTGRLLEQVEAKSVEVWVDRARQAVDVLFVDGRRTRGGPYEQLPGGTLRQQVADGVSTAVWSQSGMEFVRSR